MQMMSDSGNVNGKPFSSLHQYGGECHVQQQSMNEENPLYDESLYRLLPNPELSRACPNPMYLPDDANVNLFPQLHYYNVEGLEEDGIVANGPETEEKGANNNSQLLHHEFNGGHSLAYCCGNSSLRYENVSVPQEINSEDLNAFSPVGETTIDESAKLNYDTFQKRIRAYHPTQMQLNHRRGRNEEELQPFNSGK